MLLSHCLQRLRARLRFLFGGQRLERELNDELRFHLDRQASEYLKQGMSSEEAVRAARAAFGNVPLLREDVRAVWRWRWLDQLVQDVRCGTRTLRRSRGFAAMSVATIALAIGATTAIFSVVWGILLRPLPVAEPERLVRIVNIISQRLAETWRPDGTAVGQRIAFPGSGRGTDPWRTVVGVVADVRWQGPASEGTTLYVPLAQHVGAIDAMTLIVRSSGDSTLVADSLQTVVASLDSETPVSRIRAVDDVMAQAVSRPRFTTVLVLGFAALGVVLGMLGVYGVVAYRLPTRPRANSASSGFDSRSARLARTSARASFGRPSGSLAAGSSLGRSGPPS